MSSNCVANGPPDSSAAHLAAAAAHLAEGRAREAFREADKAVALRPDAASAWALIGASLAGLGEREPAALALERSLQIEPDQAPVLVRLGRIYDELDLPLLAEDRLLGAVALNPTDPAPHLHLSALYGRASRYTLACDYARNALALVSDLPDAHRNLAAALAKLGRGEDARRHRDLAYRHTRLFREAGPQASTRVLILADAGWGNSPDRYLLPLDRYVRLVWFIEYADEADFLALPPHEVIFNAIGDPDAMASTQTNVSRLVASARAALLNRPERVARTARHLAAELLGDVRDVEIPTTKRLTAETLAALGPAEAIRRAGVSAPALLRPIGSHGGEGLVLLKSLAEAPAVAPDRDCYATEFRDFRSDDGLYRKYRMFFVDRVPYPYHLAIGEHWLVHYQTSGTADHAARLAEERRFLEDPEAALGSVAMNALRAIGERLDLDFCGVDFSRLPDGRVLLFEANATMLAHPEAANGPLAHKNVYVDRILQAFWDLIERKSGK